MKALTYIGRMLSDPADGSPSSVRHIGVLLILAGIAHAFVIKDQSATTVQLLGSGLVCFGIRNKAQGVQGANPS